MVYEIVNEIAHADDEWMYQLQQQEQETPNTVISKAFELLLAARFGEALDKLESVKDAATLSAPLVQRIVAYCEQKLRK